MLLPLSVKAQEQPDSEAEQPQPSIELLEFVGSFTDKEVGYVDPLALLRRALKKLEFSQQGEKANEEE